MGTFNIMVDGLQETILKMDDDSKSRDNKSEEPK